MLAGVTFARGYFPLRFDAVSGGAPMLMQAVIQFSDRYVMAAALGGMPLALHLRLPGDYSLPLGSRRGLNLQESVGGEAGHSLLTASSYKCGSQWRGPFVREGVRESLAGLFRQSLTAKGGNGGCWSGCYGRSEAENITDRRASTAVFVDARTGRTVESGIIGLIVDIGLISRG